MVASSLRHRARIFPLTIDSPPPDLVINFAPTGMVSRREETPHLPLSVSEIVEGVHEASEIGITATHVHARTKNGEPTNDPEIYGEIITSIRKYAPDLVLCVSLSGRMQPDFESRCPPLHLEGDAKPDMGSLTPSSLNFPRKASVNAPDTVRRLAETMRDRGIVPELEIFDTGMANYANYLVAKSLVDPPVYANVIVGNIASAQLDLLHVGSILKDLPEDCIWTLGGIGRTQLAANTVAIAMGGGVRIGLEDNLYWDHERARLATNAELIKRIHELAAHLGRNIMKPAQLREKLGMRPGHGAYGREAKAG